MQGRNDCGKCGNLYDLSVRLPKRLACKHVLCQTCLAQIEEKLKVLNCPWCNVKTEQKVLNLELAVEFLPTNQQQFELNKCEVHKGYDKTLFCTDDKETLCPSCAFQKKHQGHKIIDISEELENLKQTEIQNSDLIFQQLIKLGGKQKEILKSQKAKLEQDVQTKINLINEMTSKLQEEVNKTKKQKIETLEAESKIYLD